MDAVEKDWERGLRLIEEGRLPHADVAKDALDGVALLQERLEGALSDVEFLETECEALREELERAQRERDLTRGVAKATTDRLREELENTRQEHSDAHEHLNLANDTMLEQVEEIQNLRKERDSLLGSYRAGAALAAENGALREELERVKRASGDLSAALSIARADRERLREALERIADLRLNAGDPDGQAPTIARTALEPKEKDDV